MMGYYGIVGYCVEDGYSVAVEVPCGGGGILLWYGVLHGDGVPCGGEAPPCAVL